MWYLDDRILEAIQMLMQVEVEEEKFQKYYYHISQQDQEKSKRIEWLTPDFVTSYDVKSKHLFL